MVMLDDARLRMGADVLASPDRAPWIYSLADAAIGLSYIAIAVALVALVARRDDLRFGGLFAFLAAFLALSGAFHLSAISTLFQLGATLAALVKLGAALVTASIAFALWKLLPQALSLPSAEHMRAANHALQIEIAKRMRAEERLRQAQKCEAVGQLTGGVAHDFNNLLTVVSGNVELATRALTGAAAPSDKARRYLASAMKGVEQAELLTRRLLAFSQRRTLDVRAAKVNTLIGGMSELLTRALGEAIEVRAVLGQGVGTVEVDRAQIESALLNVAVNAREAMRLSDVAEGTLTITTENIRLDDADAHVDLGRCGTVEGGEYVLISIADTGATTDRDNRDFDQVADFAKQAGGHLAIVPDARKGTVVRLYLPRTDAVATAGRSTDGRFIQHARGETVLVVEDDPNVRAYIVESLGDIGYTVIEAPDAADALDILQSAPQVDVLLTDVVMPRMGGRVLAATAQAQQPGLRVLYMTGFARDAVPLNDRRDAGVAMIAKPFTLPVLAAKLRGVLDANAPQERRLARL